jgi:hypothetical protein
MRDQIGGLRFVEKATDDIAILGKGLVQDLDRCSLSRRLVDRLIHRGHASGAETPCYPVVAEPSLLHVP